MYVLQIKNKNNSEWRTYYKYHNHYTTALLAYIKAKFDLLFTDDVEIRICKIESDDIA